MFVIVCRETGLDCDYIIKGETKEEFLKNGAEHAIYQHGMNENDIYSDGIAINLLCHYFSKVKRQNFLVLLRSQSNLDRSEKKLLRITTIQNSSYIKASLQSALNILQSCNNNDRKFKTIISSSFIIDMVTAYYYCTSSSVIKIISNIKFRDSVNTSSTISIYLLATKTNAPYDIGNLSNNLSQTKALEAGDSQSSKRKLTLNLLLLIRKEEMIMKILQAFITIEINANLISL